jgi:hypothetical protein
VVAVSFFKFKTQSVIRFVQAERGSRFFEDLCYPVPDGLESAFVCRRIVEEGSFGVSSLVV